MVTTVYRLCFLVSMMNVHLAFAEERTDSLLLELDRAIDNQDAYVKIKLNKIDDIKRELTHKDVDLYEWHLRIYNEYKSFVYDSAFKYARKLQFLAKRSGDIQKIESAKVNLGFVLLSSGLFKEALDTLNRVHVQTLPLGKRSEFYYLISRTYFDLADFSADDFYSRRYSEAGNSFLDSAMKTEASTSLRFLLMQGMKHLRMQRVKEAQKDFEELIEKHELPDADFAVAASTLSFIYSFTRNSESSKAMLIRAAITDIRSCTKETLATLNLANILYKEGDIERAYKYIKVAMNDANYYGARHRKIQVSAVFPIIEGKQLNTVEEKRKVLFIYSSIISLLTIFAIILVVIIYKQFKKLKKADIKIQKANEVLTETNHLLTDANKIKEEYVWYYFITIADYINKLETLKKTMEMKILTKKPDDLKFVVDSINVKKERDDLYHNFDIVFLKLFPDFVNEFNSLFNTEDRILLKEGQLLNTELRIFALVRLGIKDNEKIAKILDYSVATIYSYKTRLRSKSLVQNDDFDSRIMAIRAIG